jgi:hypothetical protein
MNTQGLRRAAWLTALLAPLTLIPGGAAAAKCEAQVGQALQELRVAESDVESVQIVRHKRAPNPPTNYVYDAWVRLDSCGQGYLVVSMTRSCYVQQSYTRDDCQLSGVPRY